MIEKGWLLCEVLVIDNKLADMAIESEELVRCAVKIADTGANPAIVAFYESTHKEKTTICYNGGNQFTISVPFDDFYKQILK